MSYSHSLDRSFLICFTRSAYTAFALSGKRRKIAHPVFHRFSEQITDDDADDADAGWRVKTEGGNFTRLYLVDWPTTFLAVHFLENGNISASNNECTVARRENGRVCCKIRVDPPFFLPAAKPRRSMGASDSDDIL